MDSNYGPMDFTAAAKLTKNAHHGVAENLIETCQELKDSIRISTHSRPAWDVERLRLLGFSSVTWEEDIRLLFTCPKNGTTTRCLFSASGR